MTGNSRAGRVLAFVTGAALLLGACGNEGEDRPRVDVINDGTAAAGGSGGTSGSVSGSVSASGPAPASSATAVAGEPYRTVSNVDIYFAMALDLRDLRAVMQPATEGRPVDWAEARRIYEEGRHQVRADGTLRPLASIPNDSVHAVFPSGAAVYGRPDFINGLVRNALESTGRAAGASDNARRQMVDKGVQMLFYGKTLQEMESARGRVEQNNLDNNTGAPHAVDEAWAIVAGAPDNNGARPYSLLQTAVGREGNFKLEGKLRQPLEAAFVDALVASQRGDRAAFEDANGHVEGHLNAVFYLATLRYVKSLEADTTPADRETHFAEGWTFFQTIRAAVAEASPEAARTIEAAYTRSPGEAFPASETERVYAALNEPAVLQALRIPASLVVRTPPAS